MDSRKAVGLFLSLLVLFISTLFYGIPRLRPILKHCVVFMVLVTDKKIFCNELIRIIATENYGWNAVYATKSLPSWT